MSVPLCETVQSVADDFGVIEQDLLRQVADAWRAARPGDGFPARQDIRPETFPAALAYIYLMDREPAPHHWRYRLIGNEVARALGLEKAKGLSLKDIMPPQGLPTVIERWRPVSEPGAAVYMHGAIYHNSERYAHGGRLLLPLSQSRSREVTGLLGITVSKNRPQRSGDELTLHTCTISL